MLKTLKRSLALIIALTLVFGIIASCARDEAPPPPDDTAPVDTDTDTVTVDAPEPDEDGFVNLTSLFNTVSDSSELPDWTGEVLTLTHWEGHGMGDTHLHVSENDVFWPEIERIFGIRICKETSFDNGGVDLETRLTMLASTGAWPHIATRVIGGGELIDEGLLHDLTDLLPIYAPHYWDIINRASPGSARNGYMNTGRHYGMAWYDNTLEILDQIYPGEIDPMRYQFVRHPDEWSFPLFVRDDILQLIFPDAKSQDDIEALFMEQGYFTREQVYDVPLNSPQDVIDFLYAVRDTIAEHNITTSAGRPVQTTFMSYGFDMWPLLMLFWAPMHGMSSHNWNYFITFNRQTQQFERQFDTDFFREQMRILNQLVRDGVGSEESLIDTQDMFVNKLNSGEYAVAYTWWIPDENLLRAAGYDFRYRKVYFNIPQDTSVYMDFLFESAVDRDVISIFTTVPDEQVPQILQFFDFMFSDVGMKLQVWGPRTAGLFEELEDGTRRYLNPELEANMVFGVNNEMDIRYNLSSGLMGVLGERWFAPAFPHIRMGIGAGGRWNPAYADYDMLEMPRDPAQYVHFFSSAVFMPRTRFSPAPLRDVYPWFHFDIPEIEQWWAARDAWENDAMMRILAARSDDEFDQAFARMIQISEENGFTEDVLRLIEQNLQDNFPDDWYAYTNAQPVN